MKRVASHYTFCSPSMILRRAVVEQDDLLNVTQIFSLDEGFVESAHTQFFDGIISGEIISIKQNTNLENIKNLVEEFHYIDLSNENFVLETYNRTKPLLIDFGTNSVTQINLKLTKLTIRFPIFEFIAACVYYPTLLIGQSPELQENRKSKLILWENVDLVKMELKFHSFIREL